MTNGLTGVGARDAYASDKNASLKLYTHHGTVSYVDLNLSEGYFLFVCVLLCLLFANNLLT